MNGRNVTGIKGSSHHHVILVRVSEGSFEPELIMSSFRNHSQRTWTQLADPSTDFDGEINCDTSFLIKHVLISS